MRIESIGGIAWDTSGSYGNNNWARPASLNTYLNGTYYNGLKSTAQSQIVAKDWSIGAVTYRNNNLATQINEENATKWNGKVALATLSEYLRSNSNKSSCGTFSLYNNNVSSCKNTTWMFYSRYYWWTLSPYDDSSGFESNYVFGVNSYGGHIGYINANETNGAPRPALYLSSEVTLTGSGTQSDPYVVNS